MVKKNIITEKQATVLYAIRVLQLSREKVTLYKLARKLRYSGTSSVQRHIDPLRKKGIIDNSYHLLINIDKLYYTKSIITKF